MIDRYRTRVFAGPQRQRASIRLRVEVLLKSAPFLFLCWLHKSGLIRESATSERQRSCRAVPGPNESALPLLKQLPAPEAHGYRRERSKKSDSDSPESTGLRESGNRPGAFDQLLRLEKHYQTRAI